MTHPLTPPPELRNKWLDEAPVTSLYDYLIERAAQWGYQQAVKELENYLEQQHVA